MLGDHGVWSNLSTDISGACSLHDAPVKATQGGGNKINSVMEEPILYKEVTSTVYAAGS